MENNQTFRYTYSAKEQQEIRKIRSKYIEPAPENKIEKLRRLDKSVTDRATVVSLIVGILGALLMGSGMSLIMSDLSVYLNIQKPLIPGLIMGVAGMIIALCAYPLYDRITRKAREKLAPEILQLTDELLQ